MPEELDQNGTADVVTDESVTDENVTDRNGTAEGVTELSVTDRNGTDLSGTDESVIDEGVIDESVTMHVWRGDATGGEFAEYVLPAQEGEVVLDVIHRCRPPRRPIWPAAGTARPGSAAHARPRSTAGLRSCA